ncbi:MAG: tetratricopeptide repeat protein, partial [Phaeodactylibacter sp.]|nr:tetratricopeptide repeat protein [Phaeodactylibacter sp.]
QLNLGNAYDHLGRYEEALDAYRSALRHADQYGDPDFAMQIRNNIGIPLKKLGRLDESEQVLRQVLKYATAKGYQKDMAAANDNLGDLYMIRGDFLRALELYHRAILQTAPGFRDESIEQNPDKEALKEAADKKRLLNFLNNKANAWKACYESTREPGYLQNALQCYRRADEVAGLMRQEHSEQSSKLFWRYTTRPVYEQAIEACYLLGDAEQAFFFME